MKPWIRVVWIVATATIAVLLAAGTTVVGPFAGFVIENILTGCEYQCYLGSFLGLLGGCLLGVVLAIGCVLLSVLFYRTVTRTPGTSQTKGRHD